MSRSPVVTAVDPSGAGQPGADSESRASDRGTRVAVTGGQRGLWALQRMAPTSPVLHIAIAARVLGEIDTAAFVAALRATVERHAAWRTTFHENAGGVEAWVHAEAWVAVLEEAVPASEPDALTGRLETIAAVPFDLARGPLVRVAVVRQGERAHVLFVVHHLVADLWSLAVAMREVGVAYGRALAFQTSGLGRSQGDRSQNNRAHEERSEGPVDTGEWGHFVERQEQMLAGDEGMRLERYWREQLADLPTPAALPADRPAPAVPGFQGGVVHAWLDDTFTDRLRRWSRAQGTTPLPVLLTAFNLLLARYTGQRDVVVGTPVAGRRGRDVAKLVGYLVQMIALRNAVDEDQSFETLVARADVGLKDGLAHQAFPLTRLAGRSTGAQGGPFHDGRSPYFRVALAYQKAPRRGPAAAFGALSIGMAGVRFPLGPMTLESIPLETNTAQLDLTVLAAEVDGRLGLAFRYDAERFDHATVVQWQRHFIRLLAAALAEPEAPARDLALLDADDHERLLRRFNDTARVIDLPRTSIDRLVARQIRTTPEALAVSAPDGRLTYAQLGDRATRVAAGLRESVSSSVGPEQVVAVFVERTTWLPAVLLGTLQAGAAYLQIDPALPTDRVVALARDAGIVAVVTTADGVDQLPALDVPIVVADRLDEVAPQSEETRAKEKGQASVATTSDETLALDRLAYLIYTSGSTGTPKAVAVCHRTLRNLVAWYHHAYDLRDERLDHRVSQLAGLSFDATVFEIWPALTAGASLHLADEATRLDPARLATWLREERITIAFLPTPLAEAYLRQDGAGAPPLRVLQAAGDRLRAFRPGGFEARLLNLYGPTEATVATTEGEVPVAPAPVPGSLRALPSIGRPISNLRLYVLDGRQRLQPQGAVGELWIGGAGVARGYHGRPGLTADRFRPDPWGSRDAGGDRLYRTGDLVRHRSDGTLDFRGRTDQQLKIRGFRIEPGEVEAGLRALDDVVEAVVEARGAAEHRRLVAWVVPRSPEPDAPEHNGWATALRQHLPAYMVPSVWMRLDALPLTANGKLDRRALPAPPIAGASGAAPRTSIEKALASLWRELLAIELPGRDDDFFALGGHSLVASQVSARLRDSLGVDVPVRMLFEHPRLADLATRVEALVAQDDVPIAPRATGVTVPLSFAQERLWFLDQLNPGLVAYNIPAAVDLRGRLRVDVLHASLTALVARHEVLRTRFVAASEDDPPVQVIDPLSPVPLTVTDLRALPAAERASAVAVRAEAEAATPFDLTTGPLLRATLLQVEGDDLGSGGAGSGGAGPDDAGQLDSARHTLLVTLHHSVADGLSMAVLQHELGAQYRAFASGHPSPLPPLPVQYADYAVWQRAHVASGAVDAGLDHWRTALAGIPEVMALPSDRPRPAVVDHHGARVSFSLDAARVTALDALARRHDVTLFMVLLAAFDALLGRMTGEADLVVGAPVAGRSRTEFEGLVGLFVNLVPLRTDVGGDPAFATLLGRVRATVLDAFEHQEVPFERVVEAVQPVRNQGHTPIFQVLFALVDAPQAHAALPDVDMRWWAPARASAQFDLGLSLQRTDGAITGELEYRTALFEDTTVSRMVARYQAVLDAVLADPLCPVSRLPLLTAPEVSCLATWNDTATSFIDDRMVDLAATATLPSLIVEQAARTPDAVALAFEGETWTYRTLMEHSAALARHLQTLGVGPEVLVGICVERSFDMLVGLLGIVRAGGAYVPLDPSYPKERLAFMVEDAAAPVIVLQAHLGDRLPTTEARWVPLDADADADAAWRPADGARQADTGSLDAGSLDAGSLDAGTLDAANPDSLAYMIFTSGSTGRPKGAMNRHRGIVNRLLWMRESYRLTPDDRFLQKTPFSFDVSVWELFAPLVVGARLVIASPEVHKDSHRLSLLIESEAVTVVHFVPSMLQAFLREPALDTRCGTVRQVICSGEALPIDLVDRFHAQLPGVRLDNLYGPTEAAVEVTAWPCSEADDTRVVPIGRPIANTRMHILDHHLDPAPIGVAGELFIGGVQVARGYHRRPGLTAERFVPDPRATERDAGARLYATGDRARWRNDGTIEYLGRIDFQVKLRGLRIELGEIEAVLAEHQGVREAVVGVRATPTGDQLVAYLTAEDEAPAIETLREHLGTRLPDYMVPRLFLILDALPLSPNGKADRRALGALALPALGEAVGHREPGTVIEKAIAGLWGEVLGLAGDTSPGLDDDFFALGGHSLLATQLAGRIRRQFAVALPLRALFELTTIAGLAAAIEAEGANPTTSEIAQDMEAPPLRRATGEGPWPLSFAQERLWFVDQMLDASAAYNMHGALRLDGVIAIDHLRASLDHIVARHDALRTVFPDTLGKPWAEVQEVTPAWLEVIDLTGLPVEDREQAATQYRRDAAAFSFDLRTGPLLRVVVLRLAERRHVLLLTLHHIVADGWSLGVLQRELMALYAAFEAGTAPTLPELPVQYPDYAVWQRGWLRDDALARQLAYWRDALGEDHPTVRLPAGRPRALAPGLAGATHSWRLSPARTSALAALGQGEGATLFMTVLATLQAVLHRYTGDDDVRVGAPVANRRSAAVEGLIGCFVNMLVLRGDFSGDPTFRTVLGRVRSSVIGAQAHQDMPYEQLVEALRPARDAAQSALFNVLLAFQNTPTESLALPGVTVARMPLVSEHAKFDLSLNVEPNDGGLDVDFEFRTDVLTAATVARLTGHLEQLIDGVLDDVDQPISTVSLLTSAERTSLLRAGATAIVPFDQVLVLDAARQMVPVGVVGERCIVRCPRDVEASVWHEGDIASVGRLHATGEAARWHDDGSIERLGRFEARRASRATPTPRPSVRATAASAPYEAPETTEETRISAIFAEVLGRERVGRHEDFFTLGGHSLLATQAAARIRESLGVDLELRTLFEHATVAALADQLTTSGAAPSKLHTTPVIPVSRDQPLVLSFAQERLWILEQLEPGTTAYNMPSALRLRGRLDRSALAGSLDALVARHESLRTVFVADNGVPRQEIVSAQTVPLNPVDLRGVDAQEQAEVLARLRDEHARTVFNLATGPLLAARLVQTADDEHELLLNVHHLVFDGWSFGVFSSELGVFYRAFHEAGVGEAGAVLLPAPPLPEPTLHYADYAAWQRAALDAEEQSRQLDYWRQCLAGAPLGTDLPTDRPRPAVRTFRGGHRHVQLDTAIRRRLEVIGHDGGATLFMVLLAGWKVIVHRWSGQDDVLVGTPVAGRTRQAFEGLIGVFLNSLVLRTDLGGNPDFATVIARVRETTLGAQAHQDVPFERLIEALAPDRDASRTPFFQLFFNMLELPQAPLELVDLRIEPVAVPETGAKFDLTLYAARADEGLRFDLIYNADLFDDDRMRALMEAYVGFLEAVATAPNTLIGAVPLAGALEAERLPNPKAALDDTWQDSVYARFLRHAEASPDHLALVEGDDAWTYAELAGHTRALAWRLTRAGVTREAPVAIYAHRSASLVWAMMAVGQAGGAFLMLDPAYPPARLIAILRRARPVVWLQLAQAGSPPADLVAYLDDEAGCARIVLPALSEHVVANPMTEESKTTMSMLVPVPVGPNDRALLAFTSGTTGEPKGIEGRHGPLSHFLPWQQATFDLAVDDRYSLLSGLAHDPLQRDVFTALTTGATLCIPDPDRMFEPGYLAAWMREAEVSVAHLTPAIGQLLVEPPLESAAIEVQSLRLAMLVGDALTQRDVARLRERAPAVRVINLYGATETQRAVSWHDGTAEGDADSRQVLPLGRGMDDVQLLVLNPAGQMAGIGELGEIWVRSPHLARGYLEDPERTAERFHVNPFADDPDDRLYRTGDLGRYRPDGEVSFAGRADQQVKIRGFRVELGEIEAQLLGHPAVSSAAVVLRGTAEGTSGPRLAAFVAGVDGTRPDPVSVRDHLIDQLPAYMVPAAIVVLDVLPLNPNGKLDRKALPEVPTSLASESASDYVDPRTEAERVLALVWGKVLGQDRVGIRDNFFALGGDSLLAIRMVSQAHRQHLAVDAKLLFQYQTIEELAPHTRPAGAIVLAPATNAVPLSQVQRRFFDEVIAGAPEHAHHFNIDRLVVVPPGFELARLAQAVEIVLQAHDAFALRLIPPHANWLVGAASEGLRQVRLSPEEAQLHVRLIDLSSLDEAARGPEVEAECARLQRSLDVFGGPLVRACIFTFGDDEPARLLLIAHHLLADAYSLVVVQEDVAVAYGQLVRQEPVQLPPSTTPFTAWAERLHAHVRSPALRAERDYWLDQPWDSARRPPVDRLEADMAISGMRGHKVMLDREHTGLLLHRAPALANGAGLNEVVLTALARAAQGWQASGDGDGKEAEEVNEGARSLHVDIIGHGRDAMMEGVDLSRTVGWLAVIFPLLVPADTREPLAALRAVRAHLLAVPNSGVGYGSLRFAGEDAAERAAMAATVPRAGLVLNFLSSLGAHDREAATEGLMLAPESAGARQASTFPLLYPLMLHSVVVDGALHLRWNFSASRYDATTVERMAGTVLEALHALADACRDHR